MRTRPAGGEPATVRKNLDDLEKTELAPFFAITGNTRTPDSTVDGLLVSHIRYQGIQGNIRSTTRPVSFDPQAMSQILSLPAFATWRTAGGLMVSDDLGSQTVRLFYDPGGQSFQARLVALDAFLAGNDLLYMGNIVSSDLKDNYSSVAQTMDFFSQKYRADPAFARRVDDSALRILASKYHLYSNFVPATVLPHEAGLSLLGQSEAITFEVARQSASLISPDKQDLDTVLPSPPVVNDHIVFLTDTRNGPQCSTCTETPMLGIDSLQNAILRLYGSQAGGQVIAGRLISYSLDSISGILAGGAGNQDLEASLRQAKWVIINMLDAEPGQVQTQLLRRFLSERQDLLRDTHVVLFAFNAPYFLDSTDISKLTAYYCLYSTSCNFLPGFFFGNSLRPEHYRFPSLALGMICHLRLPQTQPNGSSSYWMYQLHPRHRQAHQLRKTPPQRLFSVLEIPSHFGPGQSLTITGTRSRMARVYSSRYPLMEPVE